MDGTEVDWRKETKLKKSINKYRRNKK